MTSEDRAKFSKDSDSSKYSIFGQDEITRRMKFIPIMQKKVSEATKNLPPPE